MTETLPAECANVTVKAPRKKPNKKRARRQFDGRYLLGRRALALTAMFSERIGPDASDPILQAEIRRAAETTALAEHLRAQMLKGAAVPPDEVLRASRAADMMTRRLHLDRHKPQPTGTLSEYMTAKNGGAS